MRHSLEGRESGLPVHQFGIALSNYLKGSVVKRGVDVEGGMGFKTKDVVNALLESRNRSSPRPLLKVWLFDPRGRCHCRVLCGVCRHVDTAN